VEEVDTGVNPVSDEFDGFLDESINDCRVGFGDYHTVVGRFGDFGYLRMSVIRMSVIRRREILHTMMDPSPPWAMWKSLSVSLAYVTDSRAYRNSSNG
jgi:hypothetical protein